METLNNKTIGAIVASNYKTAAIFQKFSIDFCCKGGRTIQEACDAKKLDADIIENEVLAVLAEKKDESIDFNTWPLDLLADYIQKKHHRYVAKTAPVLMAYLDKINRVHGQNHSELSEVLNLFSACEKELSAHMQKEEMMLFPHIGKMVLAEEKGEDISKLLSGSVKNLIEMMMLEHIDEGERFEKISSLTNKYTPPEDACSTYKVAFATLREFEEDLHAHIHLENNILFPRAVALEKTFNETAI